MGWRSVIKRLRLVIIDVPITALWGFAYIDNISPSVSPWNWKNSQKIIGIKKAKIPVRNKIIDSLVATIMRICFKFIINAIKRVGKSKIKIGFVTTVRPINIKHREV